MTEFSVELSTGVLTKRWTPRRLVLKGQTLSLYDGASETSRSCHLAGCRVASRECQLKITTAQSSKPLIIRVANKVMLSKLEDEVVAASTSPVEPTDEHSMWDRLMSVADAMTAKLCDRVVRSNVAVEHVQAHVHALQTMNYRAASTASALDLYALLLDMEADYVARHRGPSVNTSYAHIVYQLDVLNYCLGTSPHTASLEHSPVPVCPMCKRELEHWQGYVIYQRNQRVQCNHCNEYISLNSYYKNQYGTTAFDTPLRDILSRCPHRHCCRRLELDVMHRLHLRNEPVVCSGCNNTIRYETFEIALFLREYPSMEWVSDYTTKSESVVSRLRLPKALPADGCWASFLKTINAIIDARPISNSPGYTRNDKYAVREQVLAASNIIRANALGAFPIDLVRAMHRDLEFCAAIAPHAEYWTSPGVAAASVRRYEQFLALASKRELVPTLDIALAWRAHRLHWEDYRTYSTAVAKRIVADTCFDASAYAATSAAWFKAYREPYSSYDGVQGRHFFGVDELLPRKVFTHAPAIAHNTALPPNVVVGVIGTPVFDSRAQVTGTPSWRLHELLA
ncbi:hypothetical protein ACHHYP_10808 [Achlya hypogyna]|uniref:Uncharacterized protein n=1 Tax=Achlya hypogyna TaxID=1202772 RepID=A0A1V9YKJ9_ACHHY|nr:hypothetical protein ACHHYP_10808 [Achlya hypogyna]